MIQEITRYRTDDGQVFDSVEKAQAHVVDVAGAKLGDLLVAMGADRTDVRRVLVSVLAKPNTEKAYGNVQWLRAALNGIDSP